MNTLRHLTTLMLICMASMVAVPSVAADTADGGAGCEQLLRDRVPNEIVKQVCAGADGCETPLEFISTQTTCSTSGPAERICTVDASASSQVPVEVLRQVAYADADHGGQSC